MKRRALLAATGTMALTGIVAAIESETILTISGRVGRINRPGDQTFVFTRKSFLQLRQSVITTATSWTPVSVFVGPTVVDVMLEAGVDSGTLLFKTLDNNSVPIPWLDIVRYGVILAHTQDGRPLSTKRWGPLWTIYPRDQHPDELKGPLADSRFIWQIDEIQVQA